MKFNHLWILSIVISFGLKAQNFPIEIKNLIEKYDRDFPNEKLYIRFDKPYYVISDTIWFKAYLIDAISNQVDTVSTVIYVDLVSKDDGKVIYHKLLKNEKESCHGILPLLGSLKPGAYEITGYTNWMRNFPNNYFRQEVLIYSRDELDSHVPDEFRQHQEIADLQFFPEGGNFVAGLQNRIAFKAVNQMGKGVDVNFFVISEKGDTVASGQSQHLGMGSFVMQPKANERYFAIVNKGNQSMRYNLPTVQTQGYSMFVDNLSSDKIVKVVVKKNNPETDLPVLVANQTGSIVCVYQSKEEGNAFSFLIPKADIKRDGIVHLTLFNKNGVPQCERLIYNDSQEPFTIDFKPNQEEYVSRQETILDVVIKDYFGEPVEGDFSVAVTDDQQINQDENSENIISYLQLTSEIQSSKKMLSDELRGGIEEPSYYFSSSANSLVHLDILLMTQGWRRFAWPDVLNKNMKAPDHSFETGITLSGNATRYNGKPEAKPVSISVLLKNGTQSEYLFGTTDSQGRFTVSSSTIRGHSKAFIGGIKENSRGTTKLEIDKQYFPQYEPVHYSTSPLANSFNPILAEKMKKYFEGLSLNRINSPSPGESKLLDEVVVEGGNASRDDHRKRLYYGNYTHLKVDKNLCGSYYSVFQIFRNRIPGVEVIGNPPEETVRIRQYSNFYQPRKETAYAIDGIVMPIDVVRSMAACDIEEIDVFIHPIPALGGETNGVISILTKFGNPNYDWSGEKEPGTEVVDIMGYDTPIEFYEPRYNLKVSDASTNQLDLRSTLFWSPSIKTDASGKAKIIFYNSDSKSSKTLNLQGVTNYGKPFAAKFTYQVK